MSEVIRLNSKMEISKLTEALRKLLGQRTLFLFIGEVGAGKTTVVRELCESLGMREIASPSFAIHHRYENSAGQGLDHVDLYRLKSEDDLESTGFWDLFSQDRSWIIVEWADQLDTATWPLYWPTYEVRFTKGEDESRIVEIKKIH
jgi:tRNA threonylcarbamoyladenosine biosynthesis protein TsaE